MLSEVEYHTKYGHYAVQKSFKVSIFFTFTTVSEISRIIDQTFDVDIKRCPSLTHSSGDPDCEIWPEKLDISFYGMV